MADDNDKDHPDNKKLSGEGFTSLREKSRGCTDCLCVVLNVSLRFSSKCTIVDNYSRLDCDDCYWIYCMWNC